MPKTPLLFLLTPIPTPITIAPSYQYAGNTNEFLKLTFGAILIWGETVGKILDRKTIQNIINTVTFVMLSEFTVTAVYFAMGQ